MLRTLSGTDGRYHSRAAPWGAIRAWRAGLVSRRCVLVCLFTNFIEFCLQNLAGLRSRAHEHSRRYFSLCERLRRSALPAHGTT